MQKEVKKINKNWYRAKDLEGPWKYGSLINLDEGFCYIVPPCNGASTYSPNQLVVLNMTRVNPETVCQYTGLYDKNEKSVWENDIVARRDAKGNIRALGVVRYGAFNCSCCDGVFGWTFDGDVDIREPYFYEVIGNIFDNPELLKGVEL